MKYGKKVPSLRRSFAPEGGLGWVESHSSGMEVACQATAFHIPSRFKKVPVL